MYRCDLCKKPRIFSAVRETVNLLCFGEYSASKTRPIWPFKIEGKFSNTIKRQWTKICFHSVTFLGDLEWIFHQNNVSILLSLSTKLWLLQKKVKYLAWSALSPDINPIENFWSILTNQVHSNGKQYGSLEHF